MAAKPPIRNAREMSSRGLVILSEEAVRFWYIYMYFIHSHGING